MLDCKIRAIADPCGTHEVQFYDCHVGLINDVADFLLPGLQNNETVLAIATKQHLCELEKSLKEKLGEPAYRICQSQYNCVFLDAEDTLDAISIAGWPDQQRFNQVIGDALARLVKEVNAPVRAFGEMVALLFQQGKPDAAIYLEELWNALALKYSFSLLCGYPLSAFATGAERESFDTICNLHTHVHSVNRLADGFQSSERNVTVAQLKQRNYALESELKKYKQLEQTLQERDRTLTEQAATLEEAQAQLKLEIARRQENENNLLRIKYVQDMAQKITHLGSWEIDLCTGILQCSDEFFRICGLEPQSRIIDFEFTQSIIHPDDQSAAASAVRAALEDKKPYCVEKRIIRPDGTVRHVISQSEIFFNAEQQAERAIGSFLDITELRKTEKALRQSHEELRQLASHQEKIKEEDRKRIARELHDELGGLLTGIKGYLSILSAKQESSQSSELLHEVSDIADMAMTAVQRIVNDLRPSVLDHLGIWTAVKWYAERVALKNDLTYTYAIDQSADALLLDGEQSTFLFRICQEALTNVTRHSQASAVTIRACCESDVLNVEIEDNGKGFNQTDLNRRTSWGIAGMHERALQFGGTLSIQSAAGRGTVVRLVMPLGSISHG